MSDQGHGLRTSRALRVIAKLAGRREQLGVLLQQLSAMKRDVASGFSHRRILFIDTYDLLGLLSGGKADRNTSRDVDNWERAVPSDARGELARDSSIRERLLDEIDRYALLLLLTDGPGEVVLLPEYFGELKHYVTSRFAGRYSERMDPRKALQGELNRFDSQLGRIGDDWVKAVEDALALEERIVDDRTGFEGRLDKIWETVSDLVDRVDESMSAAYVYRGFEGLVELGLIKHLGGIELGDEPGRPPLNVDLEEMALGYLSARRASHMRNNRADASALSRIVSLDRPLRRQGRIAQLVSSAPYSHGLVESANRAFAGDSVPRVNLRSVEYWRVWFAVGLATSGASPTESDVSEFVGQVLPLMREVDDANYELNDSIRNVASGAADTDALFRRVAELVKRVDVYVGDFFAPVLDSRWKVSRAERVMISLENQKRREFGELHLGVKRLRLLLSESREDGWIEEARSEVAQILSDLRSVIGEFRRGFSAE